MNGCKNKIVKIWVFHYLIYYWLFSLFLHLVQLFYSAKSFQWDYVGIILVAPIVAANGVAIFISFFAEWIQFPMVLAVLIFKKSERTKPHFGYLLLLPILSIFKALAYVLTAGAASYLG